MIKRLLAKLFSPPSWPMLRAANGLMAALFTGMAMVEGPGSSAMIDMFAAGACFAAVFYITMLIQVKRSFLRMSELFEQVSEMNHALIENRVRIHITEMQAMGSGAERPEHTDRKLH